MSDKDSKTAHAQQEEEEIVVYATTFPEDLYSKQLPYEYMPVAVPAGTQPVPTVLAVPAMYDDYNNGSHDAQNQHSSLASSSSDYEAATVIPTENYASLKYPADPGEREKELLRLSKVKGRMEAEAEKEEIQRENRKIHAIHYHTKEEIRTANELGRFKKRAEDLFLVQSSAQVPRNEYVPAPPKKEPEFYPGTYGKEYQVSEYETSQYNTTDYNISEYKSVYES